jgi:hypothetical protein
VGRGAAAVQQTGRGEQDRAGADGHQALGAGSVLAQPVGQPRLGTACAFTARDEECVRLGDVGEGLVRYDGQVAGRADGGAVQGGRADAIGARAVLLGSREDLQRAGHVETLYAVEEDEENGSLRHAINSSRATACPQ